MDRKEWLKTLKAGDKVVTLKLDQGQPALNRYYELLEIKDITDKGIITLTNGILLNKDGVYRYNNGWSMDIIIEPITQDVLDHGRKQMEYKLKRNRVMQLCKDFKYKSYTIEELNILEEVLSRPI